MERDTHYFMVGLFVIATAVAGFFFAGLFYERPTVSSKVYSIRFLTPVSGLAAGSDVRYMGIKVGEVEKVYLASDMPVTVAIHISVATDTPVNTATIASIRQQGLTGVPFISLEQDKDRKAEPLIVGEGQDLPIIPTRPTEMETLMQSLPDLEQNISEVMISVNKVLDDKNRAQFAAFLENLSGTMSSVNKVLDDKNRAQFATLLENLNEASAGLPKLVRNLNMASVELPAMMKSMGQTSRKLGDLSEQMNSAVRQIDKLAADIDRVVVNNESNINNLLGEGGENLKQLLGESRKTAVAIRQLSDGLKQNPSQILYQPAPQGMELPR